MSPLTTGTMSPRDLVGYRHSELATVVGGGDVPCGSGRHPRREEGWTLFSFSSLLMISFPCPCLETCIVCLESSARNSLVQTGCKIEGGVAPASCPLSL